ncbi:aminotransferase class I/II-fold pyridoxal phosphate-dependent enzyme [Bacillus aerolatus]|uniref:Aminotransferase n=1 Tax=Bacillus aerolatus TaxID=2653354 RepID=A0A6I1FF28_9BACI|nr:LL-diaminopimelate aminotransferase [Bacillus aerolatus]KAB7706545.1 aminotransferase class I/II-fold pyridoxal phosphate-dependent enzyme [Bacillus aerolatus]
MLFTSNKIQNLAPYFFSSINKKKKELIAQGIDVIDLGIGAPDLPTPSFVIEKLKEELDNPKNGTYSPYSGLQEYREAVASFYLKEYGVTLDPDTEVLALIGSKEGIANIIPAVVNPGESILVPDPGYPVYRTSAYLSDVNVINLSLKPENQYAPDFTEVDKNDIERSKLLFLNYPGNPTSATVDLSAFEHAVSFCKENQIGIVHDAAYSLVTYEGYKAPSILEVPDAKDIAVEMGSLSKSYNMTGWRIGYAVGNKEMIKALATLKSNIDTSQFMAIQKAACAALTSDHATVKENNNIYYERMKKMVSALNSIGIDVELPKGSFFIWAPVPKGYSSAAFAEQVLTEAGVIITPGHAFGPSGEGFFRISMSVSTDRLDEAIKRIANLKTGVTQ